ncbi:MAG: hypothetical protein DRP87_16825 [Spirochaetes bacterium]|nr:MAG: hypothetical protein DRP87_16825 [Spirochaetota bacterium]
MSYWRRGDALRTIKYCEQTLEHLGHRMWRLSKWLKAVMGLLAFLRWIYFPSRHRNCEPSSRDRLILEILSIQCSALSVSNKKEALIYMFSVLQRILSLGPSILKEHVEIIEGLNVIPAFLGMRRLAKSTYTKTSALVHDEYSRTIISFSEL